MLDSAEYRELTNGQRYFTSVKLTMSGYGSTEENVTGNPFEYVEGEVSEIQTLNQKAVNDQIRGFTVRLKRHLEELIRLVQGMVTTQLPQD